MTVKRMGNARSVKKMKTMTLNMEMGGGFLD
jgi:hypothetical protein